MKSAAVKRESSFYILYRVLQHHLLRENQQQNKTSPMQREDGHNTQLPRCAQRSTTSSKASLQDQLLSEVEGHHDHLTW